jgi:molybdenum cofactor cytidylyltransferase
MGQPKLVLPVAGQPLIVRVVETLLASFRPVWVITGPQGELVRAALAHLPVRCRDNPDHERGMVTSVQCGLRAAGRPGPWLICLGDQPGLAPGTVDAVVATALANPGHIVVPTWCGQGGHPIVLPDSCCDEVLALPTTQGLDAVVKRDPRRVVRVALADPALIEDIDTPEDYAREVRRRGAPRPGPGAA